MATSKQHLDTSVQQHLLTDRELSLRDVFPNIELAYAQPDCPLMHFRCNSDPPAVTTDILEAVAHHVFMAALRVSHSLINTGQEIMHAIVWSQVLQVLCEVSGRPVDVTHGEADVQFAACSEAFERAASYVEIAQSRRRSSSTPNRPSGAMVCVENPVAMMSNGEPAAVEKEKWVALKVYKRTPGSTKSHVAGAFLFQTDLRDPTDFQSKLREAEKEAFALWAMNALEHAYHPVFVVVTDGYDLMRLRYEGANLPGSAQPYVRRMGVDRVQGRMTATSACSLFERGTKHRAHSQSATALKLLLDSICWADVKGLCSAEIKVKLAKLDEVLNEKVNACMQVIL